VLLVGMSSDDVMLPFEESFELGIVTVQEHPETNSQICYMEGDGMQLTILNLDR